jgi:hypothetical protein
MISFLLAMPFIARLLGFERRAIRERLRYYVSGR